MIVTTTRIGDDVNLGRIAETAERCGMHGGILASHGKQRQDARMRLDYQLALRDNRHGLASLECPQAGCYMDKVSHSQSDQVRGPRHEARLQEQPLRNFRAAGHAHPASRARA
ncbi:hypothetical protein [Bradyrhizobium septentrionale]|uniref:Uncharacterized protein n=1 Tax=Bradyrhizobium septentrionale TaxID=1404411 RepID=A0ABZ2P493_9BRAD